MRRGLNLTVFALVAIVVHAQEETARSVLVFLDDPGLAGSHSRFLNVLQEAAGPSSLAVVHGEKVGDELQNWGNYTHSALVILASNLPQSLEVSTILDYVDAGHDFMLVTDSSASSSVRDLATEFGIDFHHAHSQVLEHAGVVGGEVDGSVVAAAVSDRAVAFLGAPHCPHPVLFRGLAHSTPALSTLLEPLVVAGEGAYSTMEGGAEVAAGHQLALVSAMRARNGARAVLAGSLEMLSNAFLSPPAHWEPTANAALAGALSRWVLHKAGELRVGALSHSKQLQDGTREPASVYTVGDRMHVSLPIDQFHSDGRGWQPFAADDVQIELILMDPRVRATLSCNVDGVFSGELRIPEDPGLYKLAVHYDHPGLSVVDVSTSIPVRPLKHYQHPRFLVAAYPYYASCFSMMAGLFILGLVFLYHKE